MRSFALVAEGMTDVAVIERIAQGVFGNDAVINPLMPLRDATDATIAKTATFSNWELVLQYLESEQIQIALDTNDFLIIQIDTDAGEHENFGLSLHVEGKKKSIFTTIDDCKNLLIKKLGIYGTQENLGRIIFAIPVLSTECWLVSLHANGHTHTDKTTIACEQRLSSALKGKLQKNYKSYSEIAKKFSKRKNLDAACAVTPCLDRFVAQIRTL